METTLTTPEETATPVTTDPVVDPLEESAPMEGGLRVSTSSRTREFARDWSYSQELAQWMESMPGQDLQQSLDRIDGMRFKAGHNFQTATDKTLNPMRSDGSGESLGVLIANAHYEHLSDLAAPIAETRALSGQLAARGYEPTVKTDQSASQMLSEYSAPLSDSRLGEMDEVMLYYSGHGSTTGILGVESESVKGESEDGGEKTLGSTDIVTAGTLLSIARKISAQGADVNVVLDCCHSGGMNETIGKKTPKEAAQEAVSCLDEEGAARFREAFQSFSTLFFRFRQTNEQKAAVDAATVSTTAAIEANDDQRDAARAQLSEHEERVASEGGTLTDAMIHAVLSQKVETLFNERKKLKAQKKAETEAVIIGLWTENYPELLALLDVFQTETGNALTAPMANPQTPSDLAKARSQLYVILGALGDRLSALQE
ncbi:MAG: hypothetical protein ACI8RZ_001939 [Myxococcota bacterium]|jgi:hypothetical protein